jgi:hypothetical protein
MIRLIMITSAVFEPLIVVAVIILVTKAWKSLETP